MPSAKRLHPPSLDNGIAFGVVLRDPADLHQIIGSVVETNRVIEERMNAKISFMVEGTQ